MKLDFFIGKKNKTIVKEAKALGFDHVYFVKEVSAISEIKKEKSQKNYDAVLIKTSSVDMLRRMVDKASNFIPLIFVLGMNDKINRASLENKKVKALVSPEYERNHDWSNYRNSGLNQVLCKIARDNNKAVIINFKDILFRRGHERAILLGRIMQNIRLCRKYKVKLRIGSFASRKEEMRAAPDLNSFCAAIGMNTTQVKEALSAL